VKLVEAHGEHGLRACLQKVSPTENNADVTISTVHKAKGCEWGRVWVTDDFSPYRKDRDGKESVDEAEMRLLYVAITRGRESVRVPDVLVTRLGLQQPPSILRVSGRAVTVPDPDDADDTATPPDHAVNGPPQETAGSTPPRGIAVRVLARLARWILRWSQSMVARLSERDAQTGTSVQHSGSGRGEGAESTGTDVNRSSR
jgi:hypothetical protein